jgi:uncharacterized damage-inducible protein DinB
MISKEILTKINNIRSLLLQAIDGLEEDNIVNSPVEGSWTIKDTLGHISAWDTTVIKPLRELILHGEFIPEIIDDHLAWNDEQYGLRKETFFHEIINELHQTREELLTLAKGGDEKDRVRIFKAPWGGEGTIDWMLDGLAWHEDEHTQTIRSWRNRNLL